MKTRIFIITLLILLFPTIRSQSPQENLNKYWVYRENLYSKFIVDVDPNNIPVGAPDNGTNAPANVYNPTTYGDKDNTVSWGDATIHLGQYIAMLATEYKLMQMENQDLTDVKQKLWRAMDALNRLDDNAEPFCGCGQGITRDITTPFTNINGFFIRDDVDSISFHYWKNNQMTTWQNDGIVTYKSDYDNPDETKTPRYDEMSQDQVWHLLLGLALVKKLVDDPTLVSDSKHGTKTLAEMAEDQTLRIIKMMQTRLTQIYPWMITVEEDPLYPGFWPPCAYSKAYVLRIPCTAEKVFRGGDFQDLFFSNKLFESAGNWITDGALGNYPAPGDTPNSLPYLSKAFNNVGLLNLATIGGTNYASDLVWLLNNIRSCADEFNKDVEGNPFDMKYFWLDPLPLIYLTLHEEDINYIRNLFLSFFYGHVETILNEAPLVGPHRFDNNFNEYVWNAPSILGDPYGVYKLSDRQDLFGYYNGVDYMLLHNLLHIVSRQYFSDPISIVDDFPYELGYFPGFNRNYGSSLVNIGHADNSSYLTINSWDKITMNSTVKSNGKLRLRGGSIELLPGFKVELGGQFEASSIYQDIDLDFTPPTN